ncbi:N-acetylmuramoyl-L-alanine amidase [Aequitasia blattaphilus]|uniref:N-acetylmuramoyl-L-alanine amidase n=1 Tax=Aequitasia blattaphilus TaxID=2949332 RepID=A0ABT1E5W9_9FIRM|nr:N-acetylmuramoyl-L-alanine amidase [Aequitasia blattaphilus]MCP1101239.1 N-acetylmuramoyl-L-alanine amidase [Aequitasia blattaphilus]MCR8613879.1 N-acetylmuramoyl-L-alanine amidase [Aequitasia blattaphilus]
MEKKIKFVILICTFFIFITACSENTKEEDSVSKLIIPEKKQQIEEQVEEPKVEEEDTEQDTEPVKKGILIAIDPGHQGAHVDMSALEPNAPGSSEMKAKATGGTMGRFTGIPEYQLNLDISLMLRDALIQQGYDVLLTREDNDTAISNMERATLANERGADISVRIHANGSENAEAMGALVLTPSAGNPYIPSLYEPSRRLGELVLNSYCEATGFSNKGIQENDTMTGINWSNIPVIILEMGFMTNQQDDQSMADESMRQKMVSGIVKGINQYYGYE